MKKRVLSLAVAAVMAGMAAAAFLNSRGAQTIQMSYPDFLEAVANRQIRRVTLGDSPSFKAVTVEGQRLTVPNPRFEGFKSELLLAGVQVEESTAGVLGFAMGVVLVAVLLAGMTRGRSRGAFAKYAHMGDERQVPDMTFAQVAGGGEALQSMRDLVDFLKTPEIFAAYGARAPRGVMLYGPPGTGKTLMARALAGEARVPFFAVSGADFVQVYVGVGASRVRSLFQKARKAGRAVIFIDEIDAIGKKRDNGNDEREQTLNALLTEMSGFGSGEGIVVLAATNRLDTLDEALLRAGRFDRQIEVPLPDMKERQAILAVHSQRLPLAETVDLAEVAAQTPYFSGAKLESLLNEAAILAARRKSGAIEPKDVEQALIHTLAGTEKPDKRILLREKEITCAHEAGHALVTHLLLPETQIKRVTVIPSSRGAAGYVMSVPPDQLFLTCEELENNLAVALAGRAAEEVAFGVRRVTTGAANDLQKAAQLAMDMVGKWGMSPRGLLPEQPDKQREAAAQLVNESYERALALIRSHESAWLRLRNALMRQETLTGGQVQELLAA